MLIKINQEQHELIKILRLSGMSFAKIAKKIKTSTSFVVKYCKNHNIICKTIKKKVFRSFDLDKNICKLYADGYSSIQISKITSLSKPSVLRALHTNNINVKTDRRDRGFHIFDKTFFNNMNSFKKAYWLGFIAGDGCVYKNQLIIRLSKKDIQILQQFKKDINATNPIFEYSAMTGYSSNNLEYCMLTITSHNIINDLLKYGIGKKKSKTLQIKNIPDEFANGFILGLIDADGCFRVNKLGNVSLSLISNIDTLQYVQDILIKNCNLNKTKLIKHHTTKEMFYLEYAGNKQMQRIYNYLYTGASFYLPRKHDRIIQCFKRK